MVDAGKLTLKFEVDMAQLQMAMQQGAIYTNEFKAKVEGLTPVLKQSEQAATTMAVRFQTLTQGTINLTTAFAQTYTSMSNLTRTQHAVTASTVGLDRAQDNLARKQNQLNKEMAKAHPDLIRVTQLTNELQTSQERLGVATDRLADATDRAKDTQILFGINILNVGFSAIQTLGAMKKMTDGLKAAEVASSLVGVATNKYVLALVIITSAYEILLTLIKPYNKELYDQYSIISNINKIMGAFNGTASKTASSYRGVTDASNGFSDSILNVGTAMQGQTQTMQTEFTKQGDLIQGWRDKYIKANVDIQAKLYQTRVEQEAAGAAISASFQDSRTSPEITGVTAAEVEAGYQYRFNPTTQQKLADWFDKYLRSHSNPLWFIMAHADTGEVDNKIDESDIKGYSSSSDITSGEMTLERLVGEVSGVSRNTDEMNELADKYLGHGTARRFNLLRKTHIFSYTGGSSKDATLSSILSSFAQGGPIKSNLQILSEDPTRLLYGVDYNEKDLTYAGLNSMEGSSLMGTDERKAYLQEQIDYITKKEFTHGIGIYEPERLLRDQYKKELRGLQVGGTNPYKSNLDSPELVRFGPGQFDFKYKLSQEQQRQQVLNILKSVKELKEALPFNERFLADRTLSRLEQRKRAVKSRRYNQYTQKYEYGQSDFDNNSLDDYMEVFNGVINFYKETKYTDDGSGGSLGFDYGTNTSMGFSPDGESMFGYGNYKEARAGTSKAQIPDSLMAQLMGPRYDKYGILRIPYKPRTTHRTNVDVSRIQRIQDMIIKSGQTYDNISKGSTYFGKDSYSEEIGGASRYRTRNNQTLRNRQRELNIEDINRSKLATGGVLVGEYDLSDPNAVVGGYASVAEYRRATDRKRDQDGAFARSLLAGMGIFVNMGSTKASQANGNVQAIQQAQGSIALLEEAGFLGSTFNYEAAGYFANKHPGPMTLNDALVWSRMVHEDNLFRPGMTDTGYSAGLTLYEMNNAKGWFKPSNAYGLVGDLEWQRAWAAHAGFTPAQAQAIISMAGGGRDYIDDIINFKDHLSSISTGTV